MCFYKSLYGSERTFYFEYLPLKRREIFLYIKIFFVVFSTNKICYLVKVSYGAPVDLRERRNKQHEYIRGKMEWHKQNYIIINSLQCIRL